MSKKFSELPPKESLDSADYIPIVDSADSNPETQNKIVTFQTVRGYFTEDLDEFLEQAQTAESARVTAENARRSSETTRNNNESTRQSNETTRQANEATRQANETARENAETGYIQQAKSWAVGTNGVAREGDATDNAKYYAEQASASATSASASATSASASATTAGTAKDSAQASATQAAISAESVDAPALTKKILAAFPQESLSGSLLTLSDGADGIPAKKLTLNLSPHQEGSGDPSPENVRSISGYTAVKVTRAGKNLLNDTLINTSLYEKAEDGSAINTSASFGWTYANSAFRQTLPKGDYTFVCIVKTATGTAANVQCYTSDNRRVTAVNNSAAQPGAVLSNVFSLTETTDIGVCFKNYGGYCWFMICSRSESDISTYEPYQGDTYTITIPTAAGTVYGGTLTVDQDGSGALVVDRGFVNLTGGSNEDWRESSTSYYCRFDSAIFSGKTPAPNRNDIICNRLIGIGTGTAGLAIRKGVFPDTVTSLAECIAWIQANNLECVYPLADPQTYTLTAEEVTTLLGSNTLFMSADGTIDLAYRADTTLYISNLITGIRNNIAYIENSMTASRAYSVGQFVLIGGQLYRVTASIASGATFTPGTNVTATTVGAELTALNN